MELQKLKKDILDYQIASMKNQKSPLEFNADAMKIRQDCASILFQKDSRYSIESYYNGDIICPGGSYVVNNKLFQRIENYKQRQADSSNKGFETSLQSKILHVRNQQLDRQISKNLTDLHGIDESLNEINNSPINPDSQNEDLQQQIEEKQQTLEYIKEEISTKLVQLKALKEYSLIQVKSIDQEFTVAERLQEIEDLKIQDQTNQELSSILSNMINSYQNIISNATFQHALRIKRQEVIEEDMKLFEDVSRQNSRSNSLQQQIDQASQQIDLIDEMRESQISQSGIFNQINKLLENTKVEDNANTLQDFGVIDLLQRSQTNINQKIETEKQKKDFNKQIMKQTPNKQRIPVKKQLQKPLNKPQNQYLSPQQADKIHITQLEQSSPQLSKSPEPITKIPEFPVPEPLFQNPENHTENTHKIITEKPELSIQRLKQLQIEESRRRAIERQKQYDKKQEEMKSEVVDRKTLLLQERDERIRNFSKKIETSPPKRFNLPKKVVTEEVKIDENAIMKQHGFQTKREQELDSIQKLLDEIDIDVL